jgi:DNA-binding transcriptional ArsR family regulator
VVNSSTLDDTFTALADPTRRAILTALAAGPQPVGALATPLPMSLVAVSKHISVLERAGLVNRVRSGRNQICTLTPEPLRAAAAWIDLYEQFWNARIDSLERYLEDT